MRLIHTAVPGGRERINSAITRHHRIFITIQNNRATDASLIATASPNVQASILHVYVGRNEMLLGRATRVVQSNITLDRSSGDLGVGILFLYLQIFRPKTRYNGDAHL